MPGMSIKVLGGRKIIKALTASKTISGPMNKGIRKITLKMEGLTKKATVVDTGRLRSSITHRYAGSRGFVGTSVKYASYLEEGTSRMEARHAEPGKPRVLGVGMFEYALGQLKKWIGNAEKDVARDIEKEFK